MVVAVEQQDPLDQLVGVPHLVEREVVEDLAEPGESPAVQHACVQEVGVRNGELERQRLVEGLDHPRAQP